MTVYINSLGHMTKMATMSIYGKIFFTRTSGLMSLKLEMKHLSLKVYELCMIDDPWLTLTLTNLTAMPYLAKFAFCAFSRPRYQKRPRYQVSVYRTIGPLFCFTGLVLLDV